MVKPGSTQYCRNLEALLLSSVLWGVLGGDCLGQRNGLSEEQGSEERKGSEQNVGVAGKQNFFSQHV